MPPGLILSKLIEIQTNVKLDFETMFISRNIEQSVADRETILKNQNLDAQSIANRIKNLFKI